MKWLNPALIHAILNKETWAGLVKTRDSVTLKLRLHRILIIWTNLRLIRIRLIKLNHQGLHLLIPLTKVCHLLFNRVVNKLFKILKDKSSGNRVQDATMELTLIKMNSHMLIWALAEAINRTLYLKLMLTNSVADLN